MATSMAFAAKSAGYKGVSLGGYLLGINRDGKFQLYRWMGNSGAAAAGFTDCVSTGSFYIDSDKLPPDMGGMTARLKIMDGVVVYGTTEVTFEVYSDSQSAALYTVTRRPQLSGFVAGGVDDIGSLKRIRKSQWTGLVEAAAWTPWLFKIANQLGFLNNKFKRLNGPLPGLSPIIFASLDDITEF